MEIDIKKAKEEFLNYTKKYDLENEQIKSRQSHSIRVMEMSKLIAEKLELNKQEIELATLIGLLHDIARFEQYTKYQTFWDKMSFDHGDYGVKILNEDIRKYVQTNEYDNIIMKSIKNHNKYKIEEGLTEEENLFAKIIRDADKIDILYEAIDVFNMNTKKREQIENAEVPMDTLEELKTQKLKNRDERNHEYTPIDGVLETIMFVFDINFRQSFEILKENDYINKIIDKYNFKKEETINNMEEIRNIVNSYIEHKLVIQ